MVEATYQDIPSATEQFQSLVVLFPGFIDIIVKVNHCGTRLNVYINNVIELKPDRNGTLPACAVMPIRPPRHARQILPVDLRTVSPARFDEAFFIESILDLEEKILSNSWYPILRASGILRQLLLDNFLHDVNRPYKASVRFPIYIPDLKTYGSHGFRVEGYDGDPNTRYVGIDEFLSSRAMLFEGQELSIREVIDACANAKGGVHKKGGRNDSQKAVLEHDITSSYGGLSPSLYTLQSIGRVTLRALLPLVEAIIQANR